ncbi:putative methyltransferase C9orf114 like protein [Daldinia childiae]|uniref:putative methyltransferase C9orf114 like protein n=1 Tax=Daldinia childiae TaxID=326645 RepID=UPI001447A595|nr:putative methyltransferase C9orf114 like protein [Daldinia childiae]KAF3064631.1 putative methyltransferase C9orf114 like protein [Daldinia childiae]
MASYEQDRQKKRRLTKDGDYVDTSKPTAFFKPIQGRDWTISVAVPGSVLSTCRRDDQRTGVVSHIARALAVFSIDEIVIFDDSHPDTRPRNIDPAGYTGDLDPCGYLDHLLQYLEMPPFMRRTLLPIHPNLRGAGLMSSLDIPSHPHSTDWLPYCEGVTVTGAPKGGKGTLVDVGRKELVTISDEIPPKTRITLQIDENDLSRAEPVDPSTPRVEGGYYWGFSVRRCDSLANVFEECTYEGGYDLNIGTSERGISISEAFPERKKKDAVAFNHLLIVFGGPRGLENAAENDPQLNGMGIVKGRTKELFDHWVNILPGQGSRTIRTDEALFIGLSGLRKIWEGR